MAQNETQKVQDADEFIRDHYERAAESDGAYRDQLDTYAVGNERGTNRSAYTARSPELTGGDVDAGWEYADVGEETVGGSNPTPDQDIVDDLGLAAGVTYQDNEPLDFGEKLESRDRSRWELDPASSDDYQERARSNEKEQIHGDGKTTNGGRTER